MNRIKLGTLKKRVLGAVKKGNRKTVKGVSKAFKAGATGTRKRAKKTAKRRKKRKPASGGVAGGVVDR